MNTNTTLTHPADIAFAATLDRRPGENLGVWLERIAGLCNDHTLAWCEASDRIAGPFDIDNYTPERWDAHYQPVIDALGNYAGGDHLKAARTELLTLYRAFVERMTEEATIKRSFAAIDLALVLQMFDETPVPPNLVAKAIEWAKATL